MRKNGKVYCEECGAYLIPDDPKESDGVIGSRVTTAGYIFKNPILFTKTSQWLHFCTKFCSTEHYEKNGWKDEGISKAFEEIRKDIPKMAEECAKATQKFINGLKAIQAGTDTKRNINGNKNKS